jgi:hypothetical protein
VEGDASTHNLTIAKEDVHRSHEPSDPSSKEMSVNIHPDRRPCRGRAEWFTGNEMIHLSITEVEAGEQRPEIDSG